MAALLFHEEDIRAFNSHHIVEQYDEIESGRDISMKTLAKHLPSTARESTTTPARERMMWYDYSSHHMMGPDQPPQIGCQ